MRMSSKQLMEKSLLITRIQSRSSFFVCSSNYCQDSSSKGPGSGKATDHEHTEAFKDREKKKKEAQKKMTELLMSITKQPKGVSSREEVNISHPKRKSRKEAIGPKRRENEKEDVIDFSMKRAVKDVAESLEGDVKQTESELLTALRSQSSPSHSLSEIVSGMKIDQEKTSEAESLPSRYQGAPKSRLHEFRRDGKRTRPISRDEGPINLFDSPPLGIFPDDIKSDSTPGVTLDVWNSAFEREKKISISRAPKNYFDELIKWTDEGKLWTFPIDNEIGLEEEKQYTFADHIFLEKHLEGWCPKKGPIRNFMELVCVGLSKNPHLTVNRKKAHIQWYKEYFDKKEHVLKEIGAL